jgi:hypothetical protein
MAKSKSSVKNRLMETLILVFVIVAMGLLMAQFGLNVVDTINQSDIGGSTVELDQDFATPTQTNSEPTPTFDYSDVELNDSN